MSFEPASIRTLQKLRPSNKFDNDQLEFQEEEKEGEGAQENRQNQIKESPGIGKKEGKE